MKPSRPLTSLPPQPKSEVATALTPPESAMKFSSARCQSVDERATPRRTARRLESAGAPEAWTVSPATSLAESTPRHSAEMASKSSSRTSRTTIAMTATMLATESSRQMGLRRAASGPLLARGNQMASQRSMTRLSTKAMAAPASSGLTMSHRTPSALIT